MLTMHGASEHCQSIVAVHSGQGISHGDVHLMIIPLVGVGLSITVHQLTQNVSGGKQDKK